MIFGGDISKVLGAVLLMFIGLVNVSNSNKSLSLSKKHNENDDGCPLSKQINHIMLMVSIFSVLLTSAFGLALPRILINFVRKAKKPIVALVWFSTGIILSTALTHTMTGAFNSFGSECIERFKPIHDFLHDKYVSFPGLIIMLTMLFLHLLQTVCAHGEKHSHCLDACENIKHETECENIIKAETSQKSENNTLSQIHNHSSLFTAEFGMILHSLFVGFGIGATNQYEDKAFLVAINFHQLFEGMGLASKMIKVQKRSSYWVVSALFATSTSIGTIIGALMSNLDFSPPLRHFMSGVFGAIACGVLLYSSLVDLGHLGHDHSFVKGTSRFKMCCFVGLYLGVGLMSIIAIWA